MNSKSVTQIYMYAVLAVGFVCLAFAIADFPYHEINFQLVVLVAFTLGIGSRISIQIPRFTSHIAVSDTFIFLALMLFGGEVAIVLAALEAFISSWRFCTKKISVFFNAAMWALSTTIVVYILKFFGYYSQDYLHGQNVKLTDFIIVLSIIALSQFITTTAIASIYGALKKEAPIWQTWKTSYLWTFITYFVGAVTAGVMIQFHDRIGFGIIIATFPVIFFIYLTYKMYLQNLEMSVSQAEQAKENADILEIQSKALAESEARFRSAFDYAPIGIALVAPSGSWLKVNHALSQILGYSEQEFLITDYQTMISPDDLGNTMIKIHELISGKIPACQMEHRYINKSGETVWASWSVSTASDANSSQPNLIFQIQDITDKKLAEEKLQYDATHDSLTGLPNRNCFMTRLESALQKTSENTNHKVSVLFIDLDRFKIVNDSLGHQTGDSLLVSIADRLRDCVRPSDTVARLGGDEFTILVEGKYDIQEVVRIAERIQEKFALPFDLDGHEIYSSASIGILHHTDRHETPEDLMRDADTAMYQAKRAGKARHEVFDENMHEAMKETLQLETDLRRAIENREFEVHYQPIYSLQTGEIEGFEGLARWPTVCAIAFARPIRWRVSAATNLQFWSKVNTTFRKSSGLPNAFRKNLHFLLISNGHEIYSSASIGILHHTERHETPEDLMRDADTAMYQAKRAGKARHEVFDENMHEAMKETLQLETDLRRAIENREFEVHYQPIYSLQTGEIEGFEGLARWNHKTIGRNSAGQIYRTGGRNRRD